MMTVKELYEWAKENNAVDLNIAIQFQDEGGFYSGDTMTENDGEIGVVIAEYNSIAYVLLM